MSTDEIPLGGRLSDRPPVLVKAALAGLGLLVAFILVRLWAVIWLDSLWYSSVGGASMFRARYGTQIALVSVAFFAFFGACALSIWIADRGTEDVIVDLSDSDALGRYHDAVGPHHRKLMLVVAGVLGLMAALPAAGHWQEWILFSNGEAVGVDDPQFGLDIGYYLFTLPFLRFVLDWLTTAAITVVLATVGVYILNGGIQLQPNERQSSGGPVSSKVIAHLSVIVAGLAAIKGLRYYLVDRPLLTTGNNKVFDGAGYTAVHAKLPALMLLMLVSFFSASLLLVNVRRRGVSLPVVAGALWVVVAILATAIYPSLVQRFRVEPQKARREIPFIARNQRATLAAYGLDTKLESIPMDVNGGSTSFEGPQAEDTLKRLPILDAKLMPSTFQRLQEVEVLKFEQVDLDRYKFGDQVRSVVIGARELLRTDIPTKGSWEQNHLVYNHSRGVAVAPADTASAEGRPEFVETGSAEARSAGLELTNDAVYFGESFVDWYAIANSSRKSFDGSSFEADTGIELHSFWRRLALTVSTGEVDPLISSYIDEDSQLLLRRGIRERVAALAPFLLLSSDPYPVIVEGRLLYVIDGFTTASTYPYSQFELSADMTDGSGPRLASFNYIRNSVKATVDAYDGSIHLYRVDEMAGPADPILNAWASAFPNLFEAVNTMPVGLVNHLRYPDELLRVQSRVLGRYRISDPEVFYDGSKAWLPSADPGDQVGKTAANDSNVTTSIPPVSLFLTMPGEDEANFVKLIPYRPGSSRETARAELTGFLVANQDPTRYGELTLFEVTSVDSEGQRQSGGKVDGPSTVQSTIDSDTTISPEVTLLNANGSKINYGSMTLVPIDNKVVWVRSLFVSGSGSSDAFPSLRKVIAVSDGKAVIGDDLDEAVQKLAEGTSSSPVEDGDIAELLAEAGKLLDEGQVALSQPGGLGTYQEKQDAARKLIDRALAQLEDAP